MSLATFLNRVTGRQQERKQALIATFHDLVAALADGKEPDLGLTERVLNEAGKSVADLQKAVELRLSRLAMKAKLDAMPKHKAEIGQLSKKCAAAKAIKDEAKRVFEETTNPLYARMRQLESMLNETSSLKVRLADTCPYEELNEQMKKLLRLQQAIGQEAQKLKETADSHASFANVAQSHVDRRPWDEPFTTRQKAELERWERSAKANRGKLVEVEKRLEALREQERALREKMLVP